MDVIRLKVSQKLLTSLFCAFLLHLKNCSVLSVTDLSKVLLDHCSRADKMENSSLSLCYVETICCLLSGETTQKEVADREANIDPTCFELRGKMYGCKHQWQG